MKTNHIATRGERNNNPLNIRDNKAFKWQGQIGHDADGFVIFSSLKWGIRAAFALMRSYSHKYKCDTIRNIISRWAPPTENNTEKYILDVSNAVGLSPDERIHYKAPQMRTMIKTMAKIESNMILDDGVVFSAQAMIL